MSLVLVDTSIWISLLRKKFLEDDLSRLESLFINREAAWCGIIQLELWSGVRDARQRKELGKLNSVVRDLEISNAIWQNAFHTASLARSKGITAPAADYLIHACAQAHNVEIWHNDKHLDALAKL